MSNLSRLVAATTLVVTTALAPGLASADDHHERDGRREERGRGHDARLLPPAAAPAWTWRDDLRWDGRGWVSARWERREQGERYAQARAVRLELAGLERDRTGFYARFAFDPRRLAGYDARYLDRRAELERELQRLTWVAWR